jgi:hypothetical protein
MRCRQRLRCSRGLDESLGTHYSQLIRCCLSKGSAGVRAEDLHHRELLDWRSTKEVVVHRKGYSQDRHTVEVLAMDTARET